MSDLAHADVVIVGPAPPLRGGISQHTARLVEAFAAEGCSAAAVSYRRLYPDLFFPGRSQRSGLQVPPWSEEVIDVLRPGSWFECRRILASSRALIVLQWWHPVVAPALYVATAGVGPERLVAICHNALPHEPVPGATAAARAVLGRCGRIVFHSDSEKEVARAILGGAGSSGASGGRRFEVVPLPCLLPEELLVPAAAPATKAATDAMSTMGIMGTAATVERAAGLPELRDVAASARIVAAAGHMRSYKGTAVLLQAWKAARRPADAVLVVAGESYLARREHREVRKLAGSDPTIRIVDRYLEDEELVSFLTRAEVLVLAHVAASQSGLVPVARALGLSCIVSNAGGLAEQIGPHGDGSEVVARGDAGELARALERRLAGETPAAASRGAIHGALRVRAPYSTEGAFRAGWRQVVEAIGIANRP